MGIFGRLVFLCLIALGLFGCQSSDTGYVKPKEFVTQKVILDLWKAKAMTKRGEKTLLDSAFLSSGMFGPRYVNGVGIHNYKSSIDHRMTFKSVRNVFWMIDLDQDAEIAELANRILFPLVLCGHGTERDLAKARSIAGDIDVGKTYTVKYWKDLADVEYLSYMALLTCFLGESCTVDQVEVIRKGATSPDYPYIYNIVYDRVSRAPVSDDEGTLARHKAILEAHPCE